MRSKQDGQYQSSRHVDVYFLQRPALPGRGRLSDWPTCEADGLDRRSQDMVLGWPQAWDLTWVPTGPVRPDADRTGLDDIAAQRHDRDVGAAERPETQMTAFLGEFLASLSRYLPAMTPAQADALAEPTRLLVQACTGSIAPMRDSEGAISMLMLERARQIVRQNLACKEFGPTQLCRLLAVSRSKLYRLFAPSGGVAAFIQRERLQHAMALLSDPAEMRSVNMIAAEVGFSDHSTFSRAFRRSFGISPSQARDRSVSRQLVSVQGHEA